MKGNKLSHTDETIYVRAFTYIFGNFKEGNSAAVEIHK